jgi:hypothetical protein
MNLRSRSTRLVLIVIAISIIIMIPVSYFGFVFIRSYLYGLPRPCEELPDITTVQAVVINHQDFINQIEDTSPSASVMINERCDGKGELIIYYDVVDTMNAILALINNDTFFGVPYRLVNI